MRESVSHSQEPYVTIKDLLVMAAQQTQQVVQEILQSRRGQLVSITNKIPALDRSGKLVITPHKVPKVMEGTAMVTGVMTSTSGKEKGLGVEEGKFTQQTSLVHLQQFVEIDQTDREVSPKYEPVQESSPRQMPPSPQGLLAPSDGDPNPPPVRGSLDE